MVIQGNALHARGTLSFNGHGQAFHLLHFVIGLNPIFKGNVIRQSGLVEVSHPNQLGPSQLGEDSNVMPAERKVLLLTNVEGENPIPNLFEMLLQVSQNSVDIVLMRR